MRKRLQYAMPRVPLQKLKQRQNQPENNGKPETHVGTISRRIAEARVGKRETEKPFQVLLGGDIENIEDEFGEQCWKDGQEKVDNEFLGAAASFDFVGKKGLQAEQSIRNLGRRNVKWEEIEDLDFEEDEMQQIKRLEEKLQRRNGGKRLRVVLESELQQDDSFVKNTMQCMRHKATHNQLLGEESGRPKSDNGGTFKVEAVIHQTLIECDGKGRAAGATAESSESHESEEQGILNRMTREEKGEIQKLNLLGMRPGIEHGGAKLKVFKNTHGTDGNGKADDESLDEEQTKRKNGNKQNNCFVSGNGKNQTQTDRDLEWGHDESSESDGGWDCDEGDIPLLHRK